MKQRSKNGGNDEYFTKPEVAIRCIFKVIDKYGSDNLFIEPSAGGGSFYENLPNNKIGFDINPKCPDVISEDWFNVDVTDGSIVIGNPPFGFAASMAVKFFNHAATGAKVIAFILPKTFKKESIQNKLDRFFHLVHSEDLEKHSFLVDGSEYDVPCCFQIWEKRSIARGVASVVSDVLEFVQRDEAQFCIRRVGGRAGKLLDGLNHSASSTYFCRTRYDWVLDVIPTINLDCVNNTAGVRSISKRELVSLILEKRPNHEHRHLKAV